MRLKSNIVMMEGTRFGGGCKVVPRCKYIMCMPEIHLFFQKFGLLQGKCKRKARLGWLCS